jgi:hypothetical protein
LLRRIVLRLDSIVGPALLTKWFKEGATGTWEHDRSDYSRLKLMTTCLASRPKDLADPTEADYLADLATHQVRVSGHVVGDVAA